MRADRKRWWVGWAASVIALLERSSRNLQKIRIAARRMLSNGPSHPHECCHAKTPPRFRTADARRYCRHGARHHVHDGVRAEVPADRTHQAAARIFDPAD